MAWMRPPERPHPLSRVPTASRRAGPDQGRHLPEERRDAVPAEQRLLADVLAIDGLALPRDLLPHADQVLLRRPLLSSRCSRWHRVPRPRRVDGATCHPIDAMPHAAASSSRRRVSTRRCRQKLISPFRCSDEARATPPPPLATPSRRPARPLTLFVYLSSRVGGFSRAVVRVEPLGAVEAHPLARDRVRAAGRVAALPAAHAQVRDGEAEVARERGREVVPAAGEVLEPDLGRGAPVRAVDEADLRASA